MQKIFLLFTIAVVAMMAFTTLDSFVLTGTIKDKSGNPIPFANIRIKGQRTGTSADASGQFTLRVKENDIIEIGAVSFLPLIIRVTNQKTINITLDNSATNNLQNAGKALLPIDRDKVSVIM